METKEKKEIQVIDFKNMPVDYSSIGVTDAALAILKEEYGQVPDCSTKEGYAIAKAGLAIFRALRSKVEVKRKELNSDAVDFKKRNDIEAKRIVDFVVALEEPYKVARKAEDAVKEKEREEKAEKEKERVAAIEKDINTIRNVVLDCHGKTSLELSGIISSLETTVIEVDRFAEHTPIAEAAKIEAIEKLTELRDQAADNEENDRLREVERENLDKERKKLEAERLENERKAEETRKVEDERLAREREKLEAEKEAEDARLEGIRKELEARETKTNRIADIKSKIQAIKDRGAYDPEATAVQLEGTINVLKNVVPNKDIYEEFTEEAFMAIGLAIASLQDFYVIAVEKERIAAAKALEEAAELEAQQEETPEEEPVKEEHASGGDDDVVDAEFVPEEHAPSDDDEDRIEFVNALVDLFPVVPTPTANGIYRAIKAGELPHVGLSL